MINAQLTTKLLLLLLLFSFTINAQGWCFSLTTNPSPEVEVTAVPVTAITIPVVVHNVYYNDAQRLTETQIQSQIAVLNEDFRSANADLDQVINWYQNKVADMEINFVLADQDPLGNPHSGIIFSPTSIDGIGNDFTNGRRNLCYDDLGGSSAWCTDCYLNIWVADLDFSGVAGVGIFPTEIASGEVPRAEDGVYIQYDRFGRGGTATAPYDLGRTCTHEIGHYLNLLHPWGNVSPPPNCNPSICCPDPVYDDLVDDTEKQTWTYAGLCPSGFQDSCPGNGGPDNYQNFMGFVEDACAIMFTQGQKDRVWDALQTYRPGLLNPDCIEQCVVGTKTPQQVDNLFKLIYSLHGELTLEALAPDLDWTLYNALGQEVSSWRSELAGGFTQQISGVVSGVHFLVVQKGILLQVRKVVL
ncbi:M43 family zinc metalloprotease [Lewinella cohaerens]|uniref:M43 family zinc metalloprotease n=1 Tax=Lewinella cohaerens TaxID=70995 RepID=UPI00039DBC7F|nr:M43 family zinc metalloprotease [Lewinella cohaerens]